MNRQPDVVERVYLMQVAAGPPPDNTPVVCYLVQTTSGRAILIDSGLPDPAHLPMGMPALRIGPNVIAQLAQIDLQPGDIDTLICTHFDLDHSGQHAAFSQAEFIVQRAHYEHARTHPRYTHSRPQWDRPELRYRLIDGDTELLPGLELIESSGHVPGHQAVLLRLPSTGPVLLTIDAVPDQASFTPDHQGSPRDLDSAGAIAATHKLLNLAAHTLHQNERRFVMSYEDILTQSPNSKTCSLYRTGQDAALTASIYKRTKVLYNVNAPHENLWNIGFLSMFHMSNDIDLFRIRTQLEAHLTQHVCTTGTYVCLL